MNFIDKTKKRIDDFQRKTPLLAFPVAVVKRYGDDNAGKQAALITYYTFLSLFPLLLLFVTILGFIAGNNPDLQAKISDQVFQYFPALGNDLRDNVQGLKSSGLALALQILVVFYGARGVAAMLQESFNNVWHVDKEHRPGFVGDNLRSFGMMLSVGLGIILGTVISYAIGAIFKPNIFITIGVVALNLAVVFGLFLVVFRLGTSNRIDTKTLIPGAAIASTGFLIVQSLGAAIMQHELPRLEGTYGTFAIALGMLFWIYLQAQVLMYALEITVVRARKDWPRKLF